GEQPEPHSLPVAIALVVGDGLKRVADRMPEVEPLTAARVALVFGYDGELGARTREDRALIEHLSGGNPLPQIATGDQRGLQHLRIAGRQLLTRKCPERVRVNQYTGGMMVGANVILCLREIDARLAAVGRVHLRDESGWHMNDRHTALIGGGAEPG